MTIKFNGCTRVVFVFRNVVVKIPKPWIWNHFLHGIISNINENRTWKWNSGKYERGYSYLLCPVLWCSLGGWILVMKRADTSVPVGRFECVEHVDQFPGDDTESNYGVFEGRLVKIDYGQLDLPMKLERVFKKVKEKRNEVQSTHTSAAPTSSS
jgi:hypothetical protein